MQVSGWAVLIIVLLMVAFWRNISKHNDTKKKEGFHESLALPSNFSLRNRDKSDDKKKKDKDKLQKAISRTIQKIQRNNTSPSSQSEQSQSIPSTEDIVSSEEVNQQPQQEESAQPIPPEDSSPTPPLGPPVVTPAKPILEPSAPPQFIGASDPIISAKLNEVESKVNATMDYVQQTVTQQDQRFQEFQQQQQKYITDLRQRDANREQSFYKMLFDNREKMMDLEQRTAGLKYDPSTGKTTLLGQLSLSNPIQSTNPSLGFAYVQNNKLMFGENGQVSSNYLTN